MTLVELSVEYYGAAALLRERIAQLRKQLRTQTDPEERWRLIRRLQMLAEMQRNVNQAAEMTAHYYEREDWSNAGYLL